MSKCIHARCRGDLNMLLVEGGALFVICPKCSEVWSVSLSAAESADDSLTPKVEFDLPEIDRSLLASMLLE